MARDGFDQDHPVRFDPDEMRLAVEVYRLYGQSVKGWLGNADLVGLVDGKKTCAVFDQLLIRGVVVADSQDRVLPGAPWVMMVGAKPLKIGPQQVVIPEKEINLYDFTGQSRRLPQCPQVVELGPRVLPALECLWRQLGLEEYRPVDYRRWEDDSGRLSTALRPVLSGLLKAKVLRCPWGDKTRWKRRLRIAVTVISLVDRCSAMGYEVEIGGVSVPIGKPVDLLELWGPPGVPPSPRQDVKATGKTTVKSAPTVTTKEEVATESVAAGGDGARRKNTNAVITVMRRQWDGARSERSRLEEMMNAVVADLKVAKDKVDTARAALKAAQGELDEVVSVYKSVAADFQRAKEVESEREGYYHGLLTGAGLTEEDARALEGTNEQEG